MTAKELIRLLKSRGCVEVRRKGSHLVIRCGECKTVIPVHSGESIKRGTLGAISRNLENCLGKDWLK